eukprot:4951154-Pleurochrysis_carterae.AAC.1
MCTASSTQNQPLSRLTTFQYKAGEDLGLDMHTDACDVTLNVCLGKEFVGAGLTLCGLRGAPAGSERRFVYRHAHVRGKALMVCGPYASSDARGAG